MPPHCTTPPRAATSTRWVLVNLAADPTIRDREHDATPLGRAEYNDQQEVAAFLAGLGE